MANILMEHLPPSGWSDVARTRDIDLLRDDIQGTKEDLREMRADIREMNTRLDHHTKWLIGIALTYGATLLGVIAAIAVTTIAG